MKGIIRQNRSYADGSPTYEIDLYLEDTPLPLYDGERSTFKLKIGTDEYECGIRYHDRTGPWMCPDLYRLDSAEKVRLSKALLKQGYKKGDRVSFHYSDKLNRITLEEFSRHIQNFRMRSYGKR